MDQSNGTITNVKKKSSLNLRSNFLKVSHSPHDKNGKGALSNPDISFFTNISVLFISPPLFQKKVLGSYKSLPLFFSSYRSNTGELKCQENVA